MENSGSIKVAFLVIFSVLVLRSGEVAGQSLTAPTASFSEQTAYPVFSPNDRIYYFCGASGHQNGSLKALSSGQTVTFTWEKFNPVTGVFDFIIEESAPSSTLSAQGDGGYRVRFRDSGVDYVFRAWIINSWIQPTATIVESDCESFRLSGFATGPAYQYYDLMTKQLISLASDFKYTWSTANNTFAAISNPLVSSPPTTNTIYRLETSDRAGCNQSAEVTYQSIVAKALFSWNTDQKSDPQFTYPEAPVEVKFINESENADPGKYEWFLFKDKAEIDKGVSVAGSIDSILTQIYSENPVYTYENSGRYMVKLVAAKETPGFTCRDTFYLKDYIVVDTSLVKVSPVFTPNGDGINDVLTIKTRSLESLNFQVFNRWGNSVHHFNRNGYIPEDSEIAAWDGRIGDKLATPGVYYYIVDAKGRDGERRRKKGFVHMIW